MDVSPAKATWGDVLRGAAPAEDVVPFGGEQAHKAFALALGLGLLVAALTPEDDYGAVLLVARPEADPVPALRAAAAGVRLPGDGRFPSRNRQSDSLLLCHFGAGKRGSSLSEARSSSVCAASANRSSVAAAVTRCSIASSRSPSSASAQARL